MTKLFAFGAGSQLLAAGTVSASITLTPRSGTTIRIFNDSDDTVFIAAGGAAVAAVIPVGATSGATPIGPGETGFTLAGGQTHLAAIMASGTANLYVTMGEGL